MSLGKAILYGKEKRGRRRKGCRSYCSYCVEGRLYANKKRLMRVLNEQKEVLQEAA